MSRYIDADKLCEKVDEILKIAKKEHQSKVIDFMTLAIVPMIVSQPTVDVAPVIRAHWIVDRYCSHCDCDIHDYDIYSKIPKYCPDCGAKMDENKPNIY